MFSVKVRLNPHLNTQSFVHREFYSLDSRLGWYFNSNLEQKNWSFIYF